MINKFFKMSKSSTIVFSTKCQQAVNKNEDHMVTRYEMYTMYMLWDVHYVHALATVTYIYS